MYILVCFSNVICFICSYIFLNVDYVFTRIYYGLLSQTYIGYIICKNMNESGSISAYIVFYANEYISARYTYVNRIIIYIYYNTGQYMQNSQNKTVHEVKNGRNVRSGAHVFDHFCSSFPSSFLQGAIFFVSSQICHTSSDIGTDWIAFCRSRFYLTVAKVPLFHCYDILKLAQLVLLLGHCLGRFMTHDML